MRGGTFFAGARWLLTRLLVALLLALAVTVFLRQFSDSMAPSPSLIGRDHWHATYQTFIGGQRQPNFPTWRGGIHTRADGIIHIHPVLPSEQGEGARLVKWFEYGGGRRYSSRTSVSALIPVRL